MQGRRDLSTFASRFDRRTQLRRAAWSLVWLTLFRPSPRPMHGWRRTLLRCFGASIGSGVVVYSDVRIWAPWNLTISDRSWIGDGVDCYNVAPVSIGPDAVVSQRSFLCTASHDYEDPGFRLIFAPIVVEREAWVAAETFVAPGVRVGEGAVVAARSCVIRDVESWSVVAGNPARVVKRRELARS